VRPPPISGDGWPRYGMDSEQVAEQGGRTDVVEALRSELCSR
jgi:hypothetical protein